ncbi:MAG: YHS domain-containing (seleno)protein [Myxococcota bacterium]
MTHPILKSVAATALFLMILATHTASAAHPIYRASLNGPALDGYDTVAYFTLGRAVRGTAEFQHEWRDTTWYFMNAEHRALFVSDPEKYAPQFGGYCAYAASRSHLYKGHPEVFTIQDGRLYFNNNESVEQIWISDSKMLIESAKRLFPKLLGDVPAKSSLIPTP